MHSKSDNGEVMIGIDDKKATINPENSGDIFFQYVLTVALNHKKMENTQKEYQRLDTT